MRLLMFLAVLLQNGGVRVRRRRPRQLLVRDGKVESGAMAAGEEVGKVGGREDEGAVENAHLTRVVYL